MPTIDLIITAGSDDASEQSTGQMLLTGSPLLNVDGVNEWNGFIFRNVNIPAGSTILNSYLTVRMSGASLDEPDVTFYGLDIAEPSTFTIASTNLSSRAKTSASVDWSNINAGTEDVNTSDLSTIIQELIDSYGPYSNGSIGIVMTSRANDINRDTSIISYEGSTSFCARLHIEYTEGNLGPSVVLDTPDEQIFTTNQPVLLFTGTDPDSDELRYQIQISDNANFPIAGSATYENTPSGSGGFHENGMASLDWEGDYRVDDLFGISFMGHGGILDKIAIELLSDDPLTDGYAHVRVYAHQGVYGVSSAPLNAATRENTPTPGWLAQSNSNYYDYDTVNPKSFKDFLFSGEERIRLEEGTPYVLMVKWQPNSGVYGNLIELSSKTPPEAYSGNVYIDSDSANYGVYSAADLAFAVYEETILLDKLSGSDSGFASSPDTLEPFASGQQVSYTIQSLEALDNAKYYWRVRVIDPGGLNSWSEWSTPRSFTVDVESGGGNTYEVSLIIDRSADLVDINNNSALELSLIFGKLVNVFTESFAVIEEFFNTLQINSLISNVAQVINESLNIEKFTQVIHDSFYTINTLLTISLLKEINSSGGFIFESSLNLNQVIDTDEGGGLSLIDYLSLNKDASLSLSSSLIAGGIVSLSRLNEFNTLTTLSMLSELLINNNLTMIGIGNSNSNVGLILSKSAFINQNGGFNLNSDLTLGRLISINSLNVLSKEEFLNISKQLGVENLNEISFNSNLDINRDSSFVLVNDLELESVLNIAREAAFGIQVIGNLDSAVSLGIALLISLSGSSLSGDIITPPARIYAIPSENRVYIIDGENRIYLIDPTVGLNDSLDKHLKGVGYTAAWYVGLTDGTPTPAAADTMASHAGWVEVASYSEATRPVLTLGAVANGSVDNSASKASFSINAPTTIGGAFIVSVNTKSGSSGILYGVGPFSGGDRAVQAGDTLNVTVTATASAT